MPYMQPEIYEAEDRKYSPDYLGKAENERKKVEV